MLLVFNFNLIYIYYSNISSVAPLEFLICSKGPSFVLPFSVEIIFSAK